MNATGGSFGWTIERIQEEVKRLGPWFHNMNLRGVQTAPDHFLGDYPREKWQNFAQIIPGNLEGKSVLDIGCNAGFYAQEMKRRGAARVLGIDEDDNYLEQARFAAEVNQLDIEFRSMSVYEIAKLGETFDVVLFLGVLYHLRYPLLALDLIRQTVVRDILLVQSLLRGSKETAVLEPDYPIDESEVFEEEGFPVMHFIENKFSGDATNWWIPNSACLEAMLRSAGFHITEHPEREVYLCKLRDPEEALSFSQSRARHG